MKNIKLNRIIFIFLFIVFIGMMLYSYFTLPDKVAVHFSPGGTPNNWMSRLNYVISFGSLGIAVPLFIIGLFHLIKSIPKGLINLPNKEYWLAPDQFQQTTIDIKNFGIWLAIILLIIFIIGSWIIYDANKHSIVHSIPMQYVIVPILLLLALFFWKFLRRFIKTS